MIFDLRIAGSVVRVDVRRTGVDEFECSLNGLKSRPNILLNARILQPGVLSLVLDGKSYRCIVEQGAIETALGLGNAQQKSILVKGSRFAYGVEDARSLLNRRARGPQADGPRPMKASMPGRVVRVLVEVGDEVGAHQGVVVIEAMKMQNELKSPKAGRIVRIAVAVGETVQAGDVLAVVD